MGATATSRAETTTTAAGSSGSFGEGLAESFAERAKLFLGQQLSGRTEGSARDLVALASALRFARKHLDGHIPSSYLERAAGDLERFADALSHADGAELVDAIEAFARREPLVFLGGALAIGFKTGRTLRNQKDSPSSQQSNS